MATKQRRAQPRPLSREERLAAQRRARQRRQLRNRLVLWGVVALVVVAVGVWWLASRQSKGDLAADLTSGSCDFDQRSDPGADHVANATYRVDPPSGGDHDPTPAPPGRYSERDVPGLANLVHSLEHGYVVLWHHPDAPDESIDAVEAVGDQFPRDVLVVPHDSLDMPVAATAWHKRLRCERAEPDTLVRFVEEFRNEGPERVPH